jgi:hypothetical protein
MRKREERGGGNILLLKKEGRIKNSKTEEKKE